MVCPHYLALALGSLLVLLTGILSAQEGMSPLTDLYCDPVPKGAEMCLGTIHLQYPRPPGITLALVLPVFTAFASDRDILPLIFIWDPATGKRINRRTLPMRSWNRGSAARRMTSRWRARLALEGEHIVRDCRLGADRHAGSSTHLGETRRPGGTSSTPTAKISIALGSSCFAGAVGCCGVRRNRLP